MQKIPHFLRNRIFLIERDLRGRIQRRFNWLEPFLFVDQVSYAFHTSKSKHGAALVRPISPRIRAATIRFVMAQKKEEPESTPTPTPAMQNPEKPPEEWATGQEPMTGPQRSYLQTLCREAGEEFNEKLTKAEASKKIDELQTKTGRGKTR